MQNGWGRWLLYCSLAALLGACSLPDLLGFGTPPLAKDLQALCLKSHLKSKAFHALAAQSPGLVKSKHAAPDDVVELWSRRLDGRGLLVSFFVSGGIKDGDNAHGACFLDDLQDRQATIRWLHRWTGVQAPLGRLDKYYLVVGPDRPKLLPVEGVEVPPTDRPGVEVYKLQILSSDTDTNVSLAR